MRLVDLDLNVVSSNCVPLCSTNVAEWIHDLHHHSTVVHEEPASVGAMQSGTTVWASILDGERTYVAFDWVRVSPTLLCLANPLQVLTNLRLTDANGVTLPEINQAVTMAGVVNSIPWQRFVGDMAPVNDLQASHQHRSAVGSLLTYAQ